MRKPPLACIVNESCNPGRNGGLGPALIVLNESFVIDFNKNRLVPKLFALS